MNGFRSPQGLVAVYLIFFGNTLKTVALRLHFRCLQGRVSLCNLAALRSSQPLPQRGGPGAVQGGAMQGGAGMVGGAMGASGEDVSARKIFVRGLSW